MPVSSFSAEATVSKEFLKSSNLNTSGRLLRISPPLLSVEMLLTPVAAGTEMTISSDPMRTGSGYFKSLLNLIKNRVGGRSSRERTTLRWSLMYQKRVGSRRERIMNLQFFVDWVSYKHNTLSMTGICEGGEKKKVTYVRPLIWSGMPCIGIVPTFETPSLLAKSWKNILSKRSGATLGSRTLWMMFFTAGLCVYSWGVTRATESHWGTLSATAFWIALQNWSATSRLAKFIR